MRVKVFFPYPQILVGCVSLGLKAPSFDGNRKTAIAVHALHGKERLTLNLTNIWPHELRKVRVHCDQR